MTIAAGFAGEDNGSDRAELRRWGVSLLAVLMLHAAAGLYLLSRQVVPDDGGPPPAAVMIDLAPRQAPTPPAPAPVTEPQLRQQVEPAAIPPVLDIAMPKVEPSPAPRPAVALPIKPPPQPKPKPVERPPPPAAPAVTAPPAPATAPPAINPGAARASWQSQVVGWLGRYKRYPRLAQEQRQEGIVYLRFTMDRQGRVLSAQIEKGSGFALLDEEVAALIQRAQPLPAPPPEVTGAQIVLTVPVEFSLRDARR